MSNQIPTKKRREFIEKGKQVKREKRELNQKKIALKSSATVFRVDSCVFVKHTHNKHGITEELDYIRTNISMD